MNLRNAQVIGITLALVVGVLAIAAPWCGTSLCATMMKAPLSAGAIACSQDAGHQLSAACAGMRQATPVVATVAPKAPAAVDLFALIVSRAPLPAVVAVRTTYGAPLDEPPRLVLDTSRLRI